MNKIKTIIFSGAVSLFGQSAYADLPAGNPITLGTINGWLISIGNFLIEGGMVLGVIVIVYSGVRWMMAGGDTKGSGDAKEILKSGIIGIAVILGVGLIIKTVMSLIGGSFFDR